MAAEYQYIWDAMKPGEYSTTTILRTVDSAHIPNDPANRDYQGFCVWLDEGNTPDPPDAPPEPPPPEPDANLRLDAGVEAAVNYFNDTPIPEGLGAANSLEARVDRLEATVKAMLEGQMSHLEPEAA